MVIRSTSFKASSVAAVSYRTGHHTHGLRHVHPVPQQQQQVRRGPNVQYDVEVTLEDV